MKLDKDIPLHRTHDRNQPTFACNVPYLRCMHPPLQQVISYFIEVLLMYKITKNDRIERNSHERVIVKYIKAFFQN